MRSFCFCPNECNSLHWWAKQKEILYNLCQQLALESYGFADRSTEWEIRTPSSAQRDMKRQPRQFRENINLVKNTLRFKNQ